MPTPSMSPGTFEAALRAAGGACLAVDEVMRAQGRQRLRRDAPARPSRRDRDADGLLPVQQRGDRGAPCAEAARRRARRDRRFRRASRQRQPGHFLERPDRDVLLDPPDAALSRHRRGVGARRAQHHRQRAAASGRRRRAIPRGDGDHDPAAARKLRPGPRDHLGRLRRAHARSARQPEFRRGRLRLGHAEADGSRRPACERPRRVAARRRLRPGRARRSRWPRTSPR